MKQLAACIFVALILSVTQTLWAQVHDDVPASPRGESTNTESRLDSRSQKVGEVVPKPCCEIVEIYGDGFILAKNRETGKTFRVQIDDKRYLQTMRIGQELILDPDGSVKLYRVHNNEGRNIYENNAPEYTSAYDRDYDGQLRDTYIAAFGGLNFLTKFQDNDIKYLGFPGRASDIKSDPGFVVGGKVGGYMPGGPLGVEVESFYSALSVPVQTVSISGAGGTAPFTWNGGSASVWTTALNLLLRYPGSSFQPYIGVGGAIVHYWDTSRSATAPGLNLLAGIRTNVTKEISLFGEFKYTYARLDLTNLGLVGLDARSTLSMPAFVFGLAVNLPSL